MPRRGGDIPRTSSATRGARSTPGILKTWNVERWNVEKIAAKRRDLFCVEKRVKGEEVEGVGWWRGLERLADDPARNCELGEKSGCHKGIGEKLGLRWDEKESELRGPSSFLRLVCEGGMEVRSGGNGAGPGQTPGKSIFRSG